MITKLLSQAILRGFAPGEASWPEFHVSLEAIRSLFAHFLSIRCDFLLSIRSRSVITDCTYDRLYVGR
jgi:hypothetical protein